MYEDEFYEDICHNELRSQDIQLKKSTDILMTTLSIYQKYKLL